MAPLESQCGVCALPATPVNSLSTCMRCNVVVYCSRDHQKAGFPTHTRVCTRAQQCREHIAREEAALRDAESDVFLPESVGLFWAIHETRPGPTHQVCVDPLPELRALQKKIKQDAQTLIKPTHKRNVHFWKYVVNLMPLAREPEPGAYAMGDRCEIKLWIVPNAQLWRDSVAFVTENARKLGDRRE